jgi:glycine/D-amino acid oxidase-like deaminating enzyme
MFLASTVVMASVLAERMQPTSGTTTSVWIATGDTPREETLSRDTSANVCVVGAGIAGLTTAYLLARAGKSVIVLDDGPIGGGMTARTTAHLTNALDDRFYELERLFGEEGSRLAGQSHTAAIDHVEEIVRSENIDCEFERLDGYLFLPTNGKLQVLEDELPA